MVQSSPVQSSAASLAQFGHEYSFQVFMTQAVKSSNKF